MTLLRDIRLLWGAAIAVALATSACASSSVSTGPSPAKCQVALTTSTPSIDANGGTGTVAVTTERECSWSVASEASWISIASSATGQGDGTVDYRVSANVDTTARQGGIAVNGRRAEIVQAAGACRFTIASLSLVVPAAGQTASVAVTTTGNCSWNAVSTASWITITGGGSGTSGNGIVNFAVAANSTGTPRAGLLTVAGQTFTVTQETPGCSYSINPTSQSISAAGGDGGPIAVTTLSGCAWAATSNVVWLNVTSGASGTGTGAVNFRVAANPDGIPRTGTLSVAGRPFTVTQESAGCSYSINPTSQSVPPSGGNGTPIAVTTLAGCTWTATNSVAWITITAGANGTGNGTVNFTVAANPTGTARTGALTVAGETFAVTQQAGACSYAINPTSQSMPAAGGNGTPIAVTTLSGCAWTATSNAAWITITAGAAGTGNGTVNFTVAANASGTPRTGTLTAAGQTFSVTQQAAACSYSINPTSQTAAAAGGPGTPIAVTATSGCSWTAASNSAWLTNVTPGTGTGNGTVNFTVAANATGAPRTGTLTVAGRTFSVMQAAAACSYSINPTSQSVAAAGGPGTPIAVTAASGCAWTAVSNAATWITNVTPGGGTGNGTVNFTVAANTGPARTGTLTVAGQTFTVTQASGCSFTLTPPTGQTVPKTAGSYPVAIAANNAACGWTAAVTTPFAGGGLSISVPSSGTGNGTATFAVTANAGPQRVGILTIAGVTFTVTQMLGP